VTDWGARAGEAYQALVAQFWDARRGLFRVVTGWRGRLRDPWHYWWQAHALDCAVLFDDRELADALVAGITRRNGGSLANAYYDDMAWLALALQGAGRYEPLVDALYADLRGGWHPEGGMRWRRGDTYRNVPASAPTAVLALRRYLAGGDPADLAFGEQAVAWLGETLLSPGGQMLDGVHARPGAVPNRDYYTYNQGTAALAYALLAQATEDAGHRATALRIALAGLPADGGVLPDEGGGDGGLFKGIYARYAGTLAGESAELAAALARNGESAWSARSPAGLFGPSWQHPPAGAVDLSTHLSGVLLLATLRPPVINAG
jgi:predicted alpha-1,6-mannanase (GH76 family)